MKNSKVVSIVPQGRLSVKRWKDFIQVSPDI